jgi:lipooligosaccharide transport system permease protein
MATPRAVRVMEGRARVYRHTWRGSAVSTFLNPVLYLAAIGLGLGTLVDAGPGEAVLGGVAYITWLTPGLLAAAAMQTGFNDSAWPVMAGLKWRRTFHATLATPVGVRDLVLGQLGWVALRVTMTATVFALVGIAFGAVPLGGGLAAVAPGALTGLAIGAPMLAFTAALRNDQHLSSMLRFGIVPMFLFSGTFFPITELPGWIQPIAYAPPLWHGVELARAAALGDPTTFGALAHAAFLFAIIAMGVTLAVTAFRRRLVR